MGGDEAGAALHEPDRVRDALEAVGARLAEDDVIGIALRERVTGLVHRSGESGLPDDERGAVGALVLEEARRGERGGPDRLLGHVETDGPQARRQVAPG